MCIVFHIQAETGVIWQLIDAGAWFQASASATNDIFTPQECYAM
jgi:hypothetical protein